MAAANINRMNKENTSLETMIRHANETLDIVLDPKHTGIPRDVVRHCKGLIVGRVVKSGCVFSGTNGTGIIMAKNEDGKWSNPSAIGFLGIGVGVVAGVETKDLLFFIFDDATLKSMSSGEGVQAHIGAQGGVAAGPIGRETDFKFDLTPSKGGGIRSTYSYAFTKGAFGGVGLQGSGVKSLDEENHALYGRDVTPHDILFGEASATYPPKDDGRIAALRDRLELLAEGRTNEWRITPVAEGSSK